MAVGSHLFPYRTQQLSPHTPKVLGWKRPGRIGSRRFYSSVAQLVEQSAVNRSVVGSSPTRGASFQARTKVRAFYYWFEPQRAQSEFTLLYLNITFSIGKRQIRWCIEKQQPVIYTQHVSIIKSAAVFIDRLAGWFRSRAGMILTGLSLFGTEHWATIQKDTSGIYTR